MFTSRIGDLVSIIDRIAEVGAQYGNQAVGHNFDEICKVNFQVDNVSEFISDFESLIDQIEMDINSVPGLSEYHKENYKRHILKMRNLFTARTFASSWQQLLATINDGPFRASLELIDPMIDLQRYQMKNRPNKDLIRKELNELKSMIENSSISTYIINMLLFDINKIILILDNENSFKENKIWDQYQKLTGSLLSVLYDFNEQERKPVWKSIINISLRLRQSIGLASDVAQIADSEAINTMIEQVTSAL